MSVIGFPSAPEDNQICVKPLRLRWGAWASPRIIQVHVQSAAQFEHQRMVRAAAGQLPDAQMPPHLVLDGPMHETALAVLRLRRDEGELLDLAYLCGLMEALINTPCAILRTDLLRRVYQEAEHYGRRLMVRWQGHAGRFLLPVLEDASDPGRFERQVAPLNNLQDFFAAVRSITAERHASLAKNYVIYYPRNIHGNPS